MTASLKKNILATVTYYDVLEYPLTLFEAFQYLMNYHDFGEGQKVSLLEVLQKLEELQTEGRLSSKQSFWFLPGKEALVSERIRREKISISKLKRMKKLITWLRYLPFIRMVGGTGSLSLRHGTRGSDWDMFVVLEERFLFTGRFILSIFLQLIGKRRHGKKIRDRACLNYFTGSNSLTVRLCDWYAAHEYQMMIPFFQTFSMDTFYRANAWMQDFRSQVGIPFSAHRLQIKDTPSSVSVRALLERILSYPYLEAQLARLQKKKIAKNPRTSIQGACIIADEHSLVFFPHPRGPKVFEIFKKRLSF